MDSVKKKRRYIETRWEDIQGRRRIKSVETRVRSPKKLKDKLSTPFEKQGAMDDVELEHGAAYTYVPSKVSCKIIFHIFYHDLWHDSPKMII